MPRLLTLAVLVLAIGGCAAPQPIVRPDLSRPRSTRFAIRPDGQKIYTSNYTDFQVVFPPGTPVRITSATSERAEMLVNNIPYQLHPVGEPFLTSTFDQVLDKMFVDDPRQLGLESMDPGLRGQIQAGVATVGMSKVEVYLAMGPPATVNFGQKTLHMSLETVLSQNRWEYYPNAWTGFFGARRVYVFTDDRLVSIQQ